MMNLRSTLALSPFLLAVAACSSTPTAEAPAAEAPAEEAPVEETPAAEETPVEDTERRAAPGAPQAPGDEGADCGGMAGLSCKDGLFCNYSLEATCGAADQTGKCTVVPQACTKDMRPVCGCDDKTYSNACGAHSQGVSVGREGACEG